MCAKCGRDHVEGVVEPPVGRRGLGTALAVNAVVLLVLLTLAAVALVILRA